MIALIAAGYFCDVIDYTIYGSLVPFIIKSGFAAPAVRALIGSATVFGIVHRHRRQGEFSDRFGRRFVYQFNLLLFGIFTILGALAPSVTLLVICRFIAGIGLGGRAAARFRLCGRIFARNASAAAMLAIVHFVGGACVWPIGTGLCSCLAPCLRRRTDPIAGQSGAGCGSASASVALIVWVFRFTLPESPRYLATHGRGKEALDVLGRLGIARADAAAVDRCGKQYQERSVLRGVHDVSAPRHCRHDLLHGVFRRRYRARLRGCRTS